MTIQALKEKVVKNEGWCTEKELRSTLIKTYLGISLLGVGFIVASFAILNSTVALIIGILVGFLCISVANLCGDSQESFTIVKKISKLWFLSIIADLGIFIALAFIGFL